MEAHAVRPTEEPGAAAAPASGARRFAALPTLCAGHLSDGPASGRGLTPTARVSQGGELAGAELGGGDAVAGGAGGGAAVAGGGDAAAGPAGGGAAVAGGVEAAAGGPVGGGA